MRNQPKRLILLLSAACLMLVAAREIPSTAEMRELIGQKEYRRVLREVARAMQLRGDDALRYDRAELLLIRAETQLAMRIEPAAAKSYREAAEAATTDADRATARAMTVLMSKSEQLAYSPRTARGPAGNGAANGAAGGEAGRQPIDIVTQRQAALDALFADELAALEPQIRAAGETRQIADVLKTAEGVDALASIERAATGSAARAEGFRETLIKRVETLLDEALIELGLQAGTIEERALRLIALPQEARAGQDPATTVKVKKRGLGPADEVALKQILETCREVASRSGEVAEQLGAEPGRFRHATDLAIRLSSRAGAILRADYSGIEERPIASAPPAPTERVEKGTFPQ